MATIITFKPKMVTKRLLSALPDRAKDVLTKRYGLNDANRMTLEAIGQQYKITRERVRQIENYAIAQILKSPNYTKEKDAFNELAKVISSHGGVVEEEALLKTLSKETVAQNHIHFMLVVGDAFKKHKEDDEFKSRWYLDEKLVNQVHDSLRKLYASLDDQALVSEDDLVNRFLSHLQEVNQEYKTNEVIKRWLSLSKGISSNPLGEWGKSTSANVNVKGMRDYAFLVIRKHGAPMHFSEVAKKISQMFNKRAHIATTHNELIKDKRFVLVGRGLYALEEWGYKPGMVRDVIKEILKREGPMTKDKLLEKVTKERHVKQNTILVNLHNSRWFKKDKDGKYSLAEGALSKK